MDPASIGAIAQLAVAGQKAAIGLGTAAIQNARAKKIAKANIRPEYQVNQQVQENRDLAASLAGTGLSDSTRINAEQSAERNLSQSLNAILRSGGDGNQIADLYANNNDAMLKLASADAELQRFNISQYLGANAALGQENQTAWQVNEFAPYANNAQLAATLRANAMQNASQGINSAEKGVSNYLLQDLFKGAAKGDIASPGNNSNPNGDNIMGAFDASNKAMPTDYNTKYGQDFVPSQRYLRSSIKSGYDPMYQDYFDNAYKSTWDNAV